MLIARLLHGHTLGEHHPFVVCDPERRRAEPDVRAAVNYDDGLAALRAAAGGTICMWRERPLPDFDLAAEKLRRPMSRVQLVVCSHLAEDPRLPPMGPTIMLTPLSERVDELPRIVDDFGRDAAAALGGALTPQSAAWVIRHESANLARIATATRRLVALNSVGGNRPRAASLLGMAKSSLAEWLATRPDGYS